MARKAISIQKISHSQGVPYFKDITCYVRGNDKSK